MINVFLSEALELLRRSCHQVVKSELIMMNRNILMMTMVFRRKKNQQKENIPNVVRCPTATSA